MKIIIMHLIKQNRVIISKPAKFEVYCDNSTVQLHSFKVVEDNHCEFCKKMRINLFCECEIVIPFRNKVSNRILPKLRINIVLDKNCLVFKTRQIFHFKNRLLLRARFFVCRCKYLESTPGMLQFINVINFVNKSLRNKIINCR